MNPIDKLLDRLEAKPSGRNRWIAKCPAHNDKSPSLAIAETGGGMVLIHCHAGCEPLDILHAVGLEFPDLTPETFQDAKPDLTHEYNIIEIARNMRANGKQMSELDLNRLELAMHRIKTVEKKYGTSHGH